MTDLESFGKKKKKKKKPFNLEELDSALPSDTAAAEPSEPAQEETVEVCTFVVACFVCTGLTFAFLILLFIFGSSG